jgi:hypothetical protein
MRPFRGYEGSMSKWAAIRAVLKIHKWNLILLAIAIVAALFTKSIVAANKPTGGAPNPNIDPL